ncbi:uncharacterized protein LOC123979657 isoform X2 [Micropterus dolomieu]|uniref:uncharacterized protein LOC123979657 isoform X2 n=1 Tax=Micropterus dolomieu TaxID=147949 RepID=UPI001E8CCE70|nr:uncharacterized protein LOC123979657 isoform X2 [Micropterus dolomieu]
MVRGCAFPNCANKMSRNTKHSFHRLPLSDMETLKLWLGVLQMDANTPVQTLRLEDHRVCSDHFDRDDYCQPKKRRSAIPKHFFLKKNAVPRPKGPAADGPQDRTGTASTTAFTVPHTATEDIPQIQHEDAAEHADSSDVSMSFGEMSQDPLDVSFSSQGTITSSSPESGSVLGSSNGETPGGWAERKWLVKDSKLMELFKRCPTCGCYVDAKTVAIHSSQVQPASYLSFSMHTEISMTKSYSTSFRKQHLERQQNTVVMPDVIALLCGLTHLPAISSSSCSTSSGSLPTCESTCSPVCFPASAPQSLSSTAAIPLPPCSPQITLIATCPHLNPPVCIKIVLPAICWSISCDWVLHFQSLTPPTLSMMMLERKSSFGIGREAPSSSDGGHGGSRGAEPPAVHWSGCSRVCLGGSLLCIISAAYIDGRRMGLSTPVITQS